MVAEKGVERYLDKNSGGSAVSYKGPVHDFNYDDDDTNLNHIIVSLVKEGLIVIDDSSTHILRILGDVTPDLIERVQIDGSKVTTTPNQHIPLHLFDQLNGVTQYCLADVARGNFVDPTR